MIKAIEGVFQTPIASYSFENSEELNKQLAKEILEIEENEKKLNNYQYSMTGKNGYHTKDDLLLRESSTFKEFENKLKHEINEYCVAVTGKPIPKGTVAISWAMVYREGDFSSTHTHPEADIATAYYVQIPKSISKETVNNTTTPPGSFVYLDPRPAARFHNMFSPYSAVAVTPETGIGLIFPGWLEHYTTPMIEDDEPRICIATNFFIPKGNPNEGRDFYEE